MPLWEKRGERYDEKAHSSIRQSAVRCGAGTGCASCGGAAQSTGKSGGTAGVTHITVWTYYNGDQLESFNKLVDQFNETTGHRKGHPGGKCQPGQRERPGDQRDGCGPGKVGAAAMPNIFSAYADTAYALDQMGMLVDLSQYLTEDERARYVQGYLDEGDFDGDGSMKIFPVAKSTELMFLNETDWEKFAQATGAAYDDLSTVEGWWPLPVPIMTGPTPDAGAGRRQGSVRPRRHGQLHAGGGPAAGRRPVRGAGRKDDLEL